MTRVKLIQPEQIERARKMLQAQPVKNLGKTKTEAADMLEKEIRAMRKKGYTIKEVSELLRKEGLVLSAMLLKEIFAKTGQVTPDATA